MPQSDRLVEDIYSLVNKQSGEKARAEVARIALLAGQYRAQQLQRKRMAAAIERRRASIADGREHTSDYPAGRLSPALPGAEGEQ